MRRSVRLVLLLWALALAFGIAYQHEAIAAAHGGCGSACVEACGLGNCSGYSGDGCSCFYVCSSGERGHTICV